MTFDRDQHQPYHRFGYKISGSPELITSKTKAVVAAGGDTSKISWYADDDVFDQLDWTKEPADRMDVLMQREVTRIRNQYQYVGLWYSGGFDSQTIVDTFIKCGMHIDELLITHKAYTNKSDNELKYALKQAHYIKRHFMPKIKISLSKQTLETVVEFYQNAKENWIEYCGHQFWVQKLFRANPNLNVGTKEVFDRAGAILIEGRDKPRVDLRDGAWYATATDAIGAWTMGTNALSFYYTRHTPEIQIKQTHLMINWLETLDGVDHRKVHLLQSHKSSGETYKEWNLAMGRSMLFCTATDVRQGWEDALHGAGLKKWVGRLENEHLKNLLKKEHKDIYNRYMGVYQDLKMFHDGAAFNTIMGKAYFIKKFNKKNYNKI